MNYLAICQRLRQEARIPGTGPTGVAGQTGILKNIVDWAAAAYDDIQGRSPRWRWLRSTWSVNTVAGDDTYPYGDVNDTLGTPALIARFRRWWIFDEAGMPNVQAYLQSSGAGTERRLIYMPWADFRYRYKMGTQNNGQIAHFTVDPQNRLMVGPKPDGVYVLSGEYQKGKQTLTADGDVPEMPADFHMLIVYEGMKKAGASDAAGEIYQRGVNEGGKLMRQLESEQLAPPSIGEPLA